MSKFKFFSIVMLASFSSLILNAQNVENKPILVPTTYNKDAISSELRNYFNNPESYFLEQKDIKTRLYNYHMTLDSINKVVENLSVENSTLKSDLLNTKSNSNYTSNSYSNSSNSNSLNSNSSNYNSSRSAASNVINVKSNSNSTNIGEEYRVQIGLFSDPTVAQALGSTSSIMATPINDKVSAYELTGFSSPEVAYKVAQDMRKIGVNGAFVTKYVNGIRDKSYNFLNSTKSTINTESTKNKINAASAAASKTINIEKSTPAINSSTNKTNFSAEEIRKMKENGN